MTKKAAGDQGGPVKIFTMTELAEEEIFIRLGAVKEAISGVVDGIRRGGSSEPARQPPIMQLKINKDAGRDHWGPVMTSLFAGGGVQGGEGATTLEWTLSSPPPFHQFEQLPRIK